MRNDFMNQLNQLNKKIDSPRAMNENMFFGSSVNLRGQLDEIQQDLSASRNMLESLNMQSLRGESKFLPISNNMDLFSSDRSHTFGREDSPEKDALDAFAEERKAFELSPTLQNIPEIPEDDNENTFKEHTWNENDYTDGESSVEDFQLAVIYDNKNRERLRMLEEIEKLGADDEMGKIDTILENMSKDANMRASNNNDENLEASVRSIQEEIQEKDSPRKTAIGTEVYREKK